MSKRSLQYLKIQNDFRAIFNQPPLTLENKQELLDHIEYELSPENLTSNGLSSKTAVASKRRDLLELKALVLGSGESETSPKLSVGDHNNKMKRFKNEMFMALGFFSYRRKIVFQTTDFSSFNDTFKLVIPYVGEVELKVKDFDVEKDGIDHYDFHGEQGFDHEKDFIVVNSISVITPIPYQNEIQDLINEAIFNGNFEVAVEEIRGMKK